MTSSNIFEMRHFLRNNDIVKWKIRSRGLVWHATRILLKGVKVKMCDLGDMVSNLVQHKRITDRGVGAKPLTAGQLFVNF